MSGRHVRWVCTAATAGLVAGALATAPGTAEAAPAVPGPGESSVAELLTELQGLYRRTQQTTERYQSAAERLKRQRTKVKGLNRELATARTALHQGRLKAGQLAREQYQGRSGLSPYLRLLLARDPQQALDESHVIGRLSERRTALVERLERTEHRTAHLSHEARKALGEQRKLTGRLGRQRDAVHGQLKRVEELLAGLGPDQLSSLAHPSPPLLGPGLGTAQRSFLTAGAQSGHRLPSRAGDRAVRYAVRQIGKPYRWGAAGPGAFDCSGLTSKAWRHAGRAIPRTSQDQWRRLPHVPMSELRPGDLVVYFPGATHVAVYLGGGLVVQAPRPGASVKVSPLASNPPIGAVRPDPGAPAVTNWSPPALPKNAMAGSDQGFGGSGPGGPDGPGRPHRGYGGGVVPGARYACGAAAATWARYA
ncbi:C40 family peptidase [Streptomyces sp. NA04227]|uniref:C40 family peptidase n=1 Tax=Streptomyces sp. NA04227 TaxID=2742136 RepID=UPI0015903D60|nr:C40 family peptidase [Streptomyces sp. NA04227]QKW09104.1 C40 family peptidase [Streptomyces sp. NA04227]